MKQNKQNLEQKAIDGQKILDLSKNLKNIHPNERTEAQIRIYELAGQYLQKYGERFRITNYDKEEDKRW